MSFNKVLTDAESLSQRVSDGRWIWRQGKMWGLKQNQRRVRLQREKDLIWSAFTFWKRKKKIHWGSRAELCKANGNWKSRTWL